MDTPIWDFLRDYNASQTVRFHMPGHKGHRFVGCELLDLTEITGADNLYAPTGIIAQSQRNAAALFHAKHTLYSTEGASQCIKAMLYLAVTCRRPGTAPMILAARNVHKAFIQAAALVDFSVTWLWPEGGHADLCRCPLTPAELETALAALDLPPAAVYVTCPDYLGGMQDIGAFAQICHRYGTLLLVDNAHGAYLRFLTPSRHPMDLGADMCCDSAHKTLPVLTGGAYLHLGAGVEERMAENARDAMALFGSTSPSYLILASLDLCNRYLAEGYPARLAQTVQAVRTARTRLSAQGWRTADADPLRLTVLAPAGSSGQALGRLLREHGMECEYQDPEHLVLMLTPENDASQLDELLRVLGTNTVSDLWPTLPICRPMEQAVSIRQAMFSPRETVPVERSLGRICADPTVSCPPAIPIAVCGERISADCIQWLKHYGIQQVQVLTDF